MTRRARIKQTHSAYSAPSADQSLASTPIFLPKWITLEEHLPQPQIRVFQIGAEDFAELSLRFMQEKLRGRDRDVRGFGRYHLATADGGRCLTVGSVAPNTSVTLDSPVVTPEAGGPPVAVEVAQGPIRVAGSPSLTGTMTALGVDNRAFYALLPRSVARGLKGKHCYEVLELNICANECIAQQCWNDNRHVRLDEISGNIAGEAQKLRFILSAVPITDEAGGQPADVASVWNWKGYLNNSWHRVRVVAR